jgi:hypothetical protein
MAVAAAVTGRLTDVRTLNPSPLREEGRVRDGVRGRP